MEPARIFLSNACIQGAEVLGIAVELFQHLADGHPFHAVFGFEHDHLALAAMSAIAGAVFAFLDGGRYALFAIVFFFSLAFPSAKILIALWASVLAGYDQDRMRRVMIFSLRSPSGRCSTCSDNPATA